MLQNKLWFIGILLLLATLNAQAQDLTGKWQWQINTSGKDIQSQYVLELDIKQEGSHITGTRTLYLKNYDDIIIYMEGNIDSDGEIKLYSGKIIKFNLPDSILVANKFSFVFQYDKYNKTSLMGMYKPEEDITKMHWRNSDSIFYDLIYKSKSRSTFIKIADTLSPKFKQILGLEAKPSSTAKPVIETDIEHSLTIPDGEVKIELYDNGTIDGDIVTLLVNDRIVSEHQKLGLKPITINIKKGELLDKTTVIIRAENLGDIPPNTAQMYITVAGKRYDLSISSTLTKQAAVILYKQK